MQKRYITTAIPYVNADPHIGFALELIQTDVMARFFRRVLGRTNVHALTGSDENSLKNVQAAEAAGEDIASFVESHAKAFQDLQPMLNLSFNDFIRTRENRHLEGAKKLWSACRPEDIYKKQYTGLYCVGCEAFYTPKEVPDDVCPEHKKPLEKIEEENYFFRLSAYQQQIEKLIESDTLSILPESRKNEVLNFVRQGLEDFSISRSQERAKHWGVDVPGDPTQVMYVWFDALSNYITALDYAKNGELYKTFWNSSECKKIHMIGKGILRFHAVYWPAILLSAGLSLPQEIFVHDYVTINGEKISKSIGNVIHPQALVSEYGTDAVRYYFLREMPSSGDGDYSKERMELRYAELANQLGNLVSRVAAMSCKYFKGEVGLSDQDFTGINIELTELMQKYDFKKYLDRVFDVIGQANEIIDKKAPFKLVKTDEAGAKEILANVAEMIRFAGNALIPIIPAAAEEIIRRYSKQKILEGEALFPRRDTASLNQNSALDH